MEPAEEQQAVRLQPLLPRLQQGLVIPGGEPHQHRPRQAGGQVPQGGQGLEHIDAADRQEQPRPRQGVEPRPVQQLQSLEGRGGGEDQNGGGQKGQGLGKVQKQHRPHPGPQQSGDPLRPRVRRRPHTPGRRGRSPPASGWRSAPLSEKIGSPRPAGRAACCRPRINSLYSTACPSCIPPRSSRPLWFFPPFYSPLMKKSRREKQAAAFPAESRRTGRGGLFGRSVVS